MHNIVFTLLIITSSLAFGQKVRLTNFKSTNCDEETDAFYAKNRIISQPIKKDTLFIKIATTANCCTSFIPSIHFEKKILKLSYEEYGEYCNCICYYEFDYTITGIKEKEYSVYLNDKKIEYSAEKYE
ncbi:hypothetical protein [Aquimarina sediminis]|uniref:hypothetical protein n=1 Tax=Aquimarina sediminis TaxID=2070536 RepID=UPI000CA08128|nr:hypothetical protein [Aquimarina sediminis]